jgi:hypothetical protein
MAWLDPVRPALPALLVLATWANLRGTVATAVHWMLGMITVVTLSGVSHGWPLIGVWLTTTLVALAIFRRRPTFALRVAAGSSAVLIAALALLWV